MHVRHAQRKHIVHSLNTLLYQLHTLSFFLSPSIWGYICRVTSQYQFARPRNTDANRSLKFWFFLIIFFNLGIIWSHAFEGASSGRAVILDFVGIAKAPSKLHLLFLDFLIIFLDLLLVVISYETTLATEQPSAEDTHDALLPISSIPPSRPPSTPLSTDLNDTNKYPQETAYAIDLRLSTIINRLRNPAPPPTASDLLPLPNLTSISARIQLLTQARTRLQQLRNRATEQARRDPPGVRNANGGEVDEREQRLPGTLDVNERD
ncbi:hypothetical protein QCA50_004361 [Cerrena zonata]|uniref:DUF1746 domain-containing protein n=1 Tax=Cerrena zonata TaxID=2478898 RepID=A0AAW0GGM0_9APHY